MDYRTRANGLMRLANWQQDNSRNARIRDYALGNNIPKPVTPFDRTLKFMIEPTPKQPIRLNQKNNGYKL